jgi:hypothetical protein
MKLPQLTNNPQPTAIETLNGQFTLFIRKPTLRESEVAMHSDLRWHVSPDEQKHADSLIERIGWLVTGWEGVENEIGQPATFSVDTLLQWMAVDGVCCESVHQAIRSQFSENRYSKKNVDPSSNSTEDGLAAKAS